MQSLNQGVAPMESSRANGQTHPHDLFILTDEQILEIEPEAQDVEVASVAPASLPANSGEQDRNSRLEAGPTREQNAPITSSAEGQTQSTQAGVPVLPEPPAWLAETMNDPQRGAEARALWESAQSVEKEAASYRAVFAKPEDARAAAERARVLDDIDRAYFAGDTAQRAQLAAMMMREDPAAFREMVFEGLRALDESGKPISNRSVADAMRPRAAMTPPGEASPASAAQASHRSQQRDDSAQRAQHAAYASFEKAANEDLERSVGNAIERTLEHALPAAGRPDGAALKQRISAAIRQDVEKALQGDRQLGEQVAQILSAKRLDNETRAQVVRLIGERAQQLVPGATKRALSDWTQTTLAAHRGNTARAGAASARREVAAAMPGPSVSQGQNAQRKDSARSARTEARDPSKGRINYGRLSDEQILDL
ncbi:MAG: hypothetical protein WB543_10500 [Candidatus Acidiferrum sp.]